MENNKSHLVLIPVICVVTFMLSQWIIKSNQTDVLFGFSSDALAGLVVGLGIGAMIMLLKQGVSKNKDHCK
ncbi:YhcB family protein [Shewanella psychrotolerans]|uniref:YhcB family protein n=1 Tax=Shewanella psychrotolerans TaxID=2864206 RepID=UPI001C65D01B|nr:YhcB family protein [Shewanella psychrotolerans]QYK02250.1 YhcB family protein [Shewanella psychrotolerans]